MFDAFTFQNLLLGLETTEDIISFRSVLTKFCEDMGIANIEDMDDNEKSYLLLTTLSNKLDIGVIEGNTVCDKCGSDNCLATIDLNLMQYIDKPVILETDQFILTFKRNHFDTDTDIINYLAECMYEITVKESGETHKIKDIELEEDLDNIMSYITEEEFARLTDDILEGGVIMYSTETCKDCEYSSSYGIFNVEDIANLLIRGYLENE